MSERTATLAEVYRRALEAGDPALVPVCFTLDVLRKYTEAGASAMRTDNAGRLMVLGRFSVDFGIVDEARVIHLTWGDLLHRVPASERAHWLRHLAPLPVNERFLRMRLRPACVDDGELRPVGS